MASINFCWQWAEGVREREAASGETVLAHESIQMPMREVNLRVTTWLSNPTPREILKRCNSTPRYMFQKNWKQIFKNSSVQFSCSVVSDSLRPHESQHARPPCPSPTPGAYPDSCPSSPWCHPAVSSSVVPFSSCPQSLPASGSFQMSQLFAASGGQSIEVSASASVLPMNNQDWSLSGWTGGSPCSPRDSHESSPTPQFKGINSLALSLLHSPTLTSIHDHWKNHSLD